MNKICNKMGVTMLICPNFAHRSPDSFKGIFYCMSKSLQKMTSTFLLC